MRSGEPARRAGVTTRTPRYYESRGLLPARRGDDGHRAHDEDDLRLLRQIRVPQDFGFGLEGARPFVECLRAGHPAGDACPASLAVYRRKLTELDALIDRLGSVRARVAAQPAAAEAHVDDLGGVGVGGHAGAAAAGRPGDGVGDVRGG
ncbi:MerR family transcriptional regulator, partial [Streptomyces sp. Act-28]